MRRIVGFLAVTALAILGTFAVGPGAAFASAPAPTCDSGLQHFLCDASSTGTTVWTITVYSSGNTHTYDVTTSAPSIYSACVATGATTSIYYTGVYQGVTQTSATRSIVCRTGPWR